MAQKPKAPDWLIENIAEASKNARKIYFLYVGFLAYCALTVVSTSDRQIILNETVSLPILKIDVSLNGFFLLAPLIAIFVFCYFQLYLNIRKKLINEIKTDYPSTGGKRLYPWMLVALDFPGHTVIDRLQSAIVKFSVWFSLPLVLALISTWFIKKHDPILSYIIGVAPIVGTIIVLCFWFQYEDVKFKIWEMPKSVLRHWGKNVLFFIVVIYEIAFLFFITPMAKDGFRGSSWSTDLEMLFKKTMMDVSKMALIEIKIKRYLKFFFCVDLSYQRLVTEPELEYGSLYWGNFREVHLEGANLSNSFLKRANLRNAHLQHAEIDFAVLTKADLRDANLRGASLWGATLQEALLWGTDFQMAHLESAKLQGASLTEANLRGASLNGANLQGAYLSGANLEFANLKGATFLTVEQLSKTKTLYKAKLDPDLMEEIKEKYPHLLEKPKPE